MKPEQTSTIGCVVIAAFLFLCILLNPSQEQHKKQLIASYNDKHPIAGGIFKGGDWAAAALRRDSYLFFSVGSIGGDTMTIGFFGMVFVVVSF